MARSLEKFGIILLVILMGILWWTNPPQRPVEHTPNLANQLSENACSFTDTINNKDGAPWLEFRALLANRYNTLDRLKEVVEIKYFKPNRYLFGIINIHPKVKLIYRDIDSKLTTLLESGITQDDFIKVRDGGFWDKILLITKSPYAAANRMDLNKVYKLSRRRPAYFGEGDVAFFDLAQASVAHINTIDLAYKMASDSSEKGYLNTFNHVTAQALITTLFNEQLADFVADVHERQNMPTLVTGHFTKEQLTDTNNYPSDNYIDLINNELGQRLGKELKIKYNINSETQWTPRLLVNYLNDIQKYYCWSFQIGMIRFEEDDEVIIRFTDKINLASKGLPYEEVL